MVQVITYWQYANYYIDGAKVRACKMNIGKALRFQMNMLEETVCQASSERQVQDSSHLQAYDDQLNNWIHTYFIQQHFPEHQPAVKDHQSPSCIRPKEFAA